MDANDFTARVLAHAVPMALDANTRRAILVHQFLERTHAGDPRRQRIEALLDKARERRERGVQAWT